jgi:hypothetical protein
LMVTQTGGCAAHTSLPDQIVIRPKPTITLSPQQPIACKGTPISITATGGNTYAWSPATGLSNATSPSPLATPDVTTTYKVLVKDDIGCTNTDSVTVKVVTPLTVTATADTFVCKGNMVQLRATGADIYTWIGNTTGLSNTQNGNL